MHALNVTGNKERRIRDLTDKPNRNRNPIEFESCKESMGDINFSVVVI